MRTSDQQKMIFTAPPPAALQPTAQIDGLWRTQSATMALLKHAYSKMEEAEARIAAQERRIRELEDLAATDPLTGLMNRRGFEKFFDQEMARIKRGAAQGSILALIDLDRFKDINDTYGHLAGDACLALISKVLLANIRIVDGAARLGGDEFALLLTQTDPEKALPRIEKIKKALDNIHLEWQGDNLLFSASIGICAVTAHSNYAQSYNSADQALYVDKSGRKRKVTSL